MSDAASGQPAAAPSPRAYPDRPWVGVGVVVWRDDRVLLVRRGKPPREGQWSLPGGAQHVGETVFETARREILEETGLDVTSLEVITVVDAITRDAAGAVQYHYTLVEVSAAWTGGEAVCGDDALDARWATVEEAVALVPWGETERVIRRAAALRGGRP